MRTTKLSNWILSVQVWPWLATLLALAIRSIALGRADLWQDEMLLVQTANPAQTLAQVLANSINIAVSMAWLPLPAAIQYIFLKILGALDSTLVVSPLINRLPGVVLGSLAIPALAQMGFAAGGRRLMLTTSIWAMLTFYFVFYSREVHAYPLLMCLAAWHWRMLLHIWNHNKGGTWFWLAWFCLEIALALTHLTAALMMGATAFVTLIAFLMAWKRREPEHLKCLFLTLLGIGVGLLAVLPYYVAILTKQNPHLMMHSSMSISLMLQDMIARMTFGEHVIGVIGGWAICGTGIGWLIMAGHTRTGLIRVL